MISSANVLCLSSPLMTQDQQIIASMHNHLDVLFGENPAVSRECNSFLYEVFIIINIEPFRVCGNCFSNGCINYAECYVPLPFITAHIIR